jgi:prepilin signal peptidase PulO-like enzyme (type II secretory pathway)
LRLPHVLTLPAAALAIFGQGNFGGGWMNALAGAGGGFLILKGAQLFSRMRSGEDGIGSGDAVFMLSLGALLGPAMLPWGLCAPCALAFTAIKIFAGRRHARNQRWLFGPFLALGCLGT